MSKLIQLSQIEGGDILKDLLDQMDSFPADKITTNIPKTENENYTLNEVLTELNNNDVGASDADIDSLFS